MKRLSAMIFAGLLWAGYASATEATPRIRLAQEANFVEELTVTAKDLSYIVANGFITVGLTDVTLVHNYDPDMDAWIFVGTKPDSHVIYVKEITNTK